jgi:hypothetical protein
MMYGNLQEKLKFTSKRKQLLQDLVIDEHQPGTILHDFGVLLETFRNDKQTLTPAHQLPLRLLTEINQQLKNPIRLDLKRPVQKSYPHIHGLYLLLRASGLRYVDSSSKKPELVVDEDSYQQWSQLNATERYGNLLEAWFLRGYADIIGEFSRPSWSLPDNFDAVAHFLASYDLDTGLQVAGNRDVETGLNYFPGRHNLGLLNLFGFIDVQSGLPQPGDGWLIEQIMLTPVGAAFLSLFYTEFFQDSTHIFAFEDEIDAPTGILHQILQPYFPEWQHTLTKPEAPFWDGVHIFKVSLGKIWRRIAIDAKQPLAVLASAILESVDFDEDHLYVFSYRNRFGILEQIYHWYMQEALIASEVLVGELSLSIGQTMTFLFDFSDNWEFDLLLEAVGPDRAVERAEILEGHGEAPEQYEYYDEDEFEDYDDE